MFFFTAVKFNRPAICQGRDVHFTLDIKKQTGLLK